MGNAASAPKPELDQLREAFDGNVLLPNEPGFGKACETWHTNPLLDTPRKPRLVLQPRSMTRSQKEMSAAGQSEVPRLSCY